MIYPVCDVYTKIVKYMHLQQEFKIAEYSWEIAEKSQVQLGKAEWLKKARYSLKKPDIAGEKLNS